MQATKEWRWVYEPEQQLKVILENEREHIAPFKPSRLVPLQPLNEAFSAEDALNFQNLYEGLERYEHVPPLLRFQASLNHAIFQRFGRPQMPQSWHFQCAEQALAEVPAVGQLVNLNSGLAEALCVICGTTTDFVECMVLRDTFPLSEIKELAQFEVIKVMPNRLQAIGTEEQQSSMDIRQA